MSHHARSLRIHHLQYPVLRLIILFTIFHHILALQSSSKVCKDGKKDVSINIWKSMLKFDNELKNYNKFGKWIHYKNSGEIEKKNQY